MARGVKVLVLLTITYVLSDALLYENGRSYRYNYETSVFFNDLDNKGSKYSQKGTGFHLQMDVDVSPVFQLDDSQLFRVKITSAKVTSASRVNQEKILGSLLKYPLYFELNKDTVNSVYLTEPDCIFCTNIKKGIAALFQLQEESGKRTEVDVSGECSAVYKKLSSNSILKTKEDCNNIEIAGQFSSSNEALEVSVNSTTTFSYDLSKGIINKVSSLNTAVSIVNIRKSINGAATSSQIFTLKDSSSTFNIIQANSIQEAVGVAEKEIGKSLILSLLPSGSEIWQCGPKCQPATSLAVSLKDDLVNDKMASLSSAKAFLKMVKSFRNSGKNTIAEVFSSPESYYIIPQLIDIAAATQTGPAHQALMELLNFDDDSGLAYVERYFLAAAYVTHPDEFILKDMLKISTQIPIDSPIKEPLLLSMSAVLYTYCQIPQQREHQVIKDIKSMLLNNITNCKDEGCELMFLRALGNAALPESMVLLLKYAEESKTTMMSFTAINSLRRLSQSYYTAEHRRSLIRIFYQNIRAYDSSVRVAALNALLRAGISLEELKEILQTCKNQEEFEISTYILKRIFDEAEMNMNLKKTLELLLREANVNNYNILSQNGKSGALTSYLANTQETNGTYTLSFETTNGGIMKRSGMVVNLMGENWKQPFMHFDIYAEGLESLVGSEAEVEEPVDEEVVEEPVEENVIEPTAGMSLTLLDVLLKQIEFFRGTTGLMSAAWNAPSELTSAFQVNLLLQDHSERVHLSNGMIVDIQVQGVASLDLSGLVSISLWSRNSHSVIKNSGGLYLEGTMKLDSSVIKAGITFTGEGESVIDFVTDADFYEMPLKLCLQMERPEFIFRQKIKRYEKLKGLKKYMVNYQRNVTIPSQSFLLNKANSLQCIKMFQDQE
ncbi:hypothetical protein SNE40_018531 [Patella caerulea]|uniref:Vitellogenin domain-containing protein n=1 Tax=Patella caerulea TaxID=87958 RepID=A0AAN8J7L3_PATCE